MRADPEWQEEYILDQDGVCIGKAGVWRKPELGYILHPDHLGKGLAQEALAKIVPRAFAKCPSLVRITAEVDPRNVASARLLEKLGFAHVRTTEKDFLYGADE